MLSRVGLEIGVGGKSLCVLVLYTLFLSQIFCAITAGVQLVYEVFNP